jgi:four helix bundle protein
MQLNHEKLDVYQASIQFLALAFQMTQNIPSGYSSLSDQFKRASLSIPLNIAEGTGKVGAKDKRRFYQIARGSATECGAILDALTIFQLTDPDSVMKGKELLYRIVCMLSKM